LKLGSRDCFIGWTVQQRKQYLSHILNNDRFLIIGGVRVKNLASHVLARNVRMVSGEWERRYGVKPYVLETFVDPRWNGSSYRAAGWQHIGRTSGYEKLRGGYRYHGQIKEVFVYVVEPEFRRIIGCQRRSHLRERSRREEKLHMMIQKVGYDPHLIDWSGIEEHMVEQMAEQLDAFHQLFVDCFQRREQRLLSQSYLRGLLSDIRHKTAESIALAFWGPEAIRCQQNFLSRYLWDEQKMLQRHQSLLAEAIGQAKGMLTVDSSEIPKKGKQSVGVARQYCGNLGKTENCQSGVFVGYTSRIGYGLADSQLYVPQEWFTDAYAERRKKCGIPQELEFQSKIQIALQLLEKQIRQGLMPSRWIGCDSFFGSDSAFRQTVDRWGKWYLAEIRSNILLWPSFDAQQPGHPEEAVAVAEIAKDPQSRFQQVILAEGSKGPITAEVRGCKKSTSPSYHIFLKDGRSYVRGLKE
jgi:hypothetical protein